MARLFARPTLGGVLLSLTAATLSLNVAGCGGGTASVSGTVRYNGKALRGGNVMFVGSDSLPHYGPIEADGKYAVAGIPAGPAKITVTSPDPRGVPGGGRDRGRGVDRKDAAAVPGRSEGPAPAPVVEGWFAIPDSYGDLSNPKLSFDVRPGPNPHDIELK